MNAKFRMFGLLVVIALAISACSSPAVAGQGQSVVVPETAQPAQPAAGPSTAPAGTKVDLGKDAKLGSFLVDDKGMTLYLYTKDTPKTSVCYDSCAQKWPPLLTKGAPVAGAGVDAAKLGTTQRKDDTLQVTYNGWPLYYWWKDTKAGDTLGQDVGGVWYVISPAGEMIKNASAEPTAAPAAAATATAPASVPALATVTSVPATAGTEVKLETNATLGQIVVDSKGMTLYLYTMDTPNKSVCYDTCAKNWPPLLATGTPKALEGVNSTKLGTTPRTDGTLQVTYNGWPLYYYAKDTQAGETKGQDVGSVWFAISPTGEMVKSPAY